MWVQVGTPAWRLPFDVVATTIPARRIVTVSRQVDAAQRTLWPRRPTTVVYPGVDTTRFDARNVGDRDAVRHRLGLPTDAVIVGAVGRLERWKGFHFVVEAFTRVADRHPNALLAIVGGIHPLDPGYADELRELVDGHGRIRLVGQQSNPEEWMQAMDVFVHASEGEPFGIVVIEAMALGKPVVASAEGGPSEVITDGVDGLLTPFGDSAAQAAAVISLLEDEDRRRRLGAAASTRAQDFAVETFAGEFGRVVQRAAA